MGLALALILAVVQLGACMCNAASFGCFLSSVFRANVHHALHLLALGSLAGLCFSFAPLFCLVSCVCSALCFGFPRGWGRLFVCCHCLKAACLLRFNSAYIAAIGCKRKRWLGCTVGTQLKGDEFHVFFLNWRHIRWQILRGACWHYEALPLFANGALRNMPK